MKSNFFNRSGFISIVISFILLATNVIAQQNLAKEREFVDSSNDRWWYTMGFVAFVCLVGAIYLWRKSKKGSDQPQYNYENRYKNYYSNESYDMEGLDADKELEWLRKAKRSTSKNPTITYGLKANGQKKEIKRAIDGNETDSDTKDFQEKMKKLRYAQLPINSFSGLAPAKDFEPLPVSDDPSLLTAIEQANEEYEDDEAIRDLAVKILTAFKTRNSIEALSQIALYDLSSNLRSKAVTTLTDFDHESVFETILLACADPTREVRAAAARGLFRLSFDRSHAWKRIIETRDDFRMSQASRAAIEAGIVVKSFDRLVHEDIKVAYEAFVLVALLIHAGETKEMFEAIREHKDDRVRFALIHVIKAIKDGRTLLGLHEVHTEGALPADVMSKLMDAIKTLEKASVESYSVV